MTDDTDPDPSDTDPSDTDPSDTDPSDTDPDEPQSDGDAATGESDPDPETELRGNWTDQIVGERMQVDREFSEKVAASNFSNQQWGLIMTAVEFEIENADDPERARLVADTSKLAAVLPELERMEGAGGMGGMAGAGGGRGGSSSSDGSGGLFDGVKEALGLGKNETDREQLAAAEEMAQMYADDLEEELQAREKWEMIVTMAGG
jgi:hypothetical protein